ncbi:MAG: proteasome assembly chaperone family protein [Candidatus Methanospirareceae archaeon]
MMVREEERIINIVEEREMEYKKPVVIEGLPDVGLVGTIAASYIVEKMKYEEIGYIESDLLPPVMVIHEGKLKSPLRVYGDEEVIVILSEIGVPLRLIYPLTRELVEWFKKIDTSLVISISGLPVENRMDLSEVKVFGVGNTEEAIRELKDKEVEVMEEGFIVGTYAIMLKECYKENLKAISLLPQCYPVYPDPGAAASAINFIGKFLGKNIDVKELLEKAEEVKLKARDLMRQTNMSVMEMQKNLERDMPIMYR